MLSQFTHNKNNFQIVCNFVQITIFYDEIFTGRLQQNINKDFLYHLTEKTIMSEISRHKNKN